jgi:hypothetical protein
VAVSVTDTIFGVPTQHIHMPANATPTPPVSGGDHHMNFHDLTTPTIDYSYYGCTITGTLGAGGTISCLLAWYGNACGTGEMPPSYVSAPNPTTAQGVITADYNFEVGTIRHWELAAGKIQHALRVTIGAGDLATGGATWCVGIPFPGFCEDQNGPSVYTGPITYGVTMGIPASTNLSGLGITTASGMVLAKALQQYGAQIRDSGANGQLTFYGEPQDSANSDFTDMVTDMAVIIPAMRVMTNQAINTPNGGGRPVVPPPPPLDPCVCH